MVYIGYVGFEAFDIILYMGRTLTKLQLRVLIVDLSDSDALLDSINNSMGLDSLEDIVNYRDLNYTRKMPEEEELSTFGNCVIFVVYGNKSAIGHQFEFKAMNVVVNTFPHTIKSVNSLIQNSVFCGENINLLVRDIIRQEDVDRVKETISLPVPYNKVNYIYYDIVDYESAIECQVSQVIRFTKISPNMQKYIIQQIHDIFPRFTTKKIRKAIASARKGV